MARKWYRSPWVTLVGIGAAIGGGVLLVNFVGKKVGLGAIGQPPFRFGPEGMSDRYRGMAWEFDLPTSSDPSACAARGSGPAAQMCFELQRARTHTKNYMEGRGGRASMDAANQSMENAMRSYYQVRQRGMIGPGQKELGGNIVFRGMYGG